MSQGKGSFVQLVTGLPIGIVEPASYPITIDGLPTECTLVASTDGLVVRRGQVIDIGLGRQPDAASRNGHPLARLSSDEVSTQTPRGSHDDIAILGMRWTE